MIYEIVYDTDQEDEIVVQFEGTYDQMRLCVEHILATGGYHICIEAIDAEDGDECPRCGGPLYYPEALNCSCHISAPCTACVMNKLECAECGYTPEGV